MKGEVPSTRIYENDDFLAFLDISPLGAGHTQVIPKKHYRWVWDVPEAGEYFEIVRKIALAQKKAFGVEIVRSQVYGEQVPHAHIWIWPEIEEGKTDFAGNAAKIIQALG